MSVQELQEKKVARSKNTTGQGENMVMKPRIILAEPDDYYLPQEMYVKQLINSPIEFGTVTIPVAMEDGEYPDHLIDSPGMKPGRAQRFEINIAMHPHFGAMICGYVDDDRHEEEDFERERKTLDEMRQVLLHDLQKRWYFEPEQLAPVGLFIAAPDIDEAMIPDGLDDDVYVFTNGDDVPLHERMMAIMVERAGGEPDLDTWQYFVGVVRGLGESYTSALEWLRIYEQL